MERPFRPAVQQEMGTSHASGREFPIGVSLVLEQHGQAVVVSPTQHQISNGGEGLGRGVHNRGS